jgi:hypothetical protein
VYNALCLPTLEVTDILEEVDAGTTEGDDTVILP